MVRSTEIVLVGFRYYSITATKNKTTSNNQSFINKYLHQSPTLNIMNLQGKDNIAYNL